MSEARSRRTFTSAQKCEIVRRHLSGKEPVSKLAEELGVQPGQIHPQSNGKLERWHGSLKGERFRLASPPTLEEARRVMAAFVMLCTCIRDAFSCHVA